MDNRNPSIDEGSEMSAKFESFLRRLDPDRDRAAEKYEDLRRRLIRFFAWNQCFPQEDLADRTFDRVTQRSDDSQIQDMAGFVWGVAKNIVRECQRQPAAIGIDELPPNREPHTGNIESQIIDRRDRERCLECLRACLQNLSELDRRIFVEYEYFAGKGRNTEPLATSLGLTVSALQSRAHRLKYKVEKCTVNCMGRRRAAAFLGLHKKR
jgi:DNA-directed RNA polymerase specialized sigma24 family protein